MPVSLHRRSRLPLAVVALSAGVLCFGGCYKRVVNAEGIGADGIQVQQPNRSNSLVDRAIFGSDKPAARTDRAPGYTPRD